MSGKTNKARWTSRPRRPVMKDPLGSKITFASEEKMHKLHPGYVCDFMKKIFNINECFLTDKSRVSDFDSSIEEVIVKIKKKYGEHKTDSWIFRGGNPLIIDILVALI